MTIEELKQRIEEHRAGLKDKSGTSCMFSETGPVGMSVIDAVVAALEAQEERIGVLERRIV